MSSLQLFSQNAGVVERLPGRLFAFTRFQLERIQHVGHNTTGVRHVRHMHQRGSTSSGMETRDGHDWIFHRSPNQTNQFDTHETMLDLRAGT